jgi:uncharacterized membrane protein YeaQ/YmgE (transglycosylase-associated protein family)
MSIIGAIIIGFLVGLFARFLMPGRYPMGFIITTLLGMGGAVVGKYVGQAMGMYRENEPAGFIMSLIGAMLILLIFHFWGKKNSV